MKNFSAYVHIPFCLRKCNYCAFNSKVGGADEKNFYVDALITEIKNRAASEIVSTIYFGGGTPTTLQLGQLERIFSALNAEPDAEITIEANPGTVDENFLRGLKLIGFNRLSLGVQSFSDKLLKILGRIHDSKTALETIHAAQKFFDNVSIDLMYGLPGQKISDVRRDIELAENLDVRHVSIYGLEVEEGTKFFELAERGKLNLPDEDLTAEMYDFITETLPRIGFARYEISNFAQKNFESRHNLGYWTGKKYFGFGAGAHSFDGDFRTANICDVGEYTKKIRAGESVSHVEEVVTHRAAMEEFCFLGLRTARGISIDDFAKNFGENIFSVYGKVIDKNLNLGLLEAADGRIFLTTRGMKFGNAVFAEFLL